MGVGLSISHAIVEADGGTLRAEANLRRHNLSLLLAAGWLIRRSFRSKIGGEFALDQRACQRFLVMLINKNCGESDMAWDPELTLFAVGASQACVRAWRSKSPPALRIAHGGR